MNVRTRTLRAAIAPGMLIAGSLLLAACYNPFHPDELTIGVVSTPPPIPDTPSGALKLLEWCYNNRAIAEYRELFTDDYRFQFGALDDYGNAYRDNPWTREDELASATKLFQGSPDKAAATSISLSLDKNFRIRNDPRPGKDPFWHKTILTSQSLAILEADGGRRDVTGSSLFFLVRGDSAVIPQELKDRGFGPDPARWYVDRWEDQSPVSPVDGITTEQVGVYRGQPEIEWVTWGYIKAYWRGRP